MKNITIEVLPIDPSRHALEIVERKGIGHPDTLCDRVAEAFSRNLSRYYLDAAGEILHHNVDKVLLVAGETDVHYGGGTWRSPIRLHIAGRATCTVNRIPAPLIELAEAAVIEAFEQLRYLTAKQVEIQVDVHTTAAELLDLYARKAGEIPLSNDTSIGVGFAPFTPTEALTLAIETQLNSADFKARLPAAGEDIKVMVVRNGDGVEVTVGVAMIAPLLDNSAAYAEAKDIIRTTVRKLTSDAGFSHAEIHINAADVPGKSEYLTLSGTSAEAEDDGEVGRGNRQNGLITPMRPMTLEAYSGKNPVTHVGKLYSVSTQRIAQACCRLQHIRSAECFLVSRIGSPITEPQSVGLRLDSDGSISDSTRSQLKEIVVEEVARLPALWRDTLEAPL